MEEANKQAKEMLQVIAKSQDYSQVKDYHQIFMDAEAIISIMAYLTGELSNREQKYRELIIKFEDEGRSHASAEARAKASDEYREWKKLERAYKLGYEQIMLLKKFQGNLGIEHGLN